MSIPDHLYAYVIKEEDYSDGAVILEEGGYGNWAYIVLEGQVKIKKKTVHGMVTMLTLGEGEVVGESNLLRNASEKRTVSVVADGMVVLGLISSDKIINDLNGVSPQMRSLIATLSKRLQEINQKFVDMLGK